MHKSAMADAEKFVKNYLGEMQTLSVADVGSYDVNGTLRPLFSRSDWSYCGMDAEPGPNVDRVLSSPYAWPEIPSASFDVVVSTQTLEHVRHPWKWMPEVARICKPGGLIYVCSPNTWAFHEYPIDCWRAWPDGLRALFDEAGVDVIEAYHDGPDTTAIGRKRSVATSVDCRLTVIVATSGRESFADTLASLQRQSWGPRDGVLIMYDGQVSDSHWVLFRDSGLPGIIGELSDGPHHDWGHTPRNRAMDSISGGYVVHLDDDDVLAPGALDAVRLAIAEHPGDFFFFRIAYPHGSYLWEEQTIKEGFVGTALFVHPAGIPLGQFAPRHGGDFDFIRDTLAKHPARKLHWRDAVTHVIRPADLWVNPQFEDVVQHGNATGREDCQQGWQEFFGRAFRGASILDVGAGLGLSRARLSVGGNTVTTHDVAAVSEVDLRCPLSEIPAESFDVVTAFDVIEHVADPFEFLRELSRIARQAIVVTTPNVWKWRCANKFHIREFSPPLLSHMLSATPDVSRTDLYASQDIHGDRPCLFPASRFLSVRLPVLGAVGWKLSHAAIIA